MDDMIYVSLIAGVVGTILFWWIGKIVFNLSSHNLEKRLRITNQLLALIAEKHGVPPEQIKQVLTGEANIDF